MTQVAAVRAEERTRLVCDQAAPANARHFVTRCLREWGEGSRTDDALLLVSELVTNAVQHGDCAATEVRVQLSAHALSIGVSDGSTRTPAVAAYSIGPGGMGLRIVDDVADRWWCDPSEAGKTVWAELGLRRRDP